MATVKVSALTETTSPNSTDELLVNQGGTSKKLQVGNLPVATPADDSITYAKIQNVSATDRILGRDTTGAGDVEEITPTNLRTMINVEDGADVTDSTNVVAALTAGTNVTISSGGSIASTDTNTTYTSSDFTHDSLSGVTANDHIDWTGASAGTIHSSNYTDTDTVYTHPSSDGNLHVPATSTTNNGKLLTAGSTAGAISWEDAPVSLPTQTSHSGKYLTTNGSAASWAAVSSNSTSSGLYEHAHTISADYTITSGNNALTAGPITIDSGYSVTIPTGSTWVVA